MDLEPGKSIKGAHWGGRTEAEKVIKRPSTARPQPAWPLHAGAGRLL